MENKATEEIKKAGTNRQCTIQATDKVIASLSEIN